MITVQLNFNFKCSCEKICVWIWIVEEKNTQNSYDLRQLYLIHICIAEVSVLFKQIAPLVYSCRMTV